MKLLIKQRIFSWTDSYDIYDENGDVYFTVKGQLSWGHTFKIYDKNINTTIINAYDSNVPILFILYIPFVSLL